ncbi:N-acetylmuramoyl-L-alanine amidase [Thiomicrorhabdus xiamenensis]|uniref:N-acetylmuramoyl-L-alanine amidase n=1 Tax=Thiomicrorhabdus xiamenensis TaxID=2739063 RepID=A0A7D4T0V5_9GAMM|nr:N-acetylmuramoyl-L-alanine amidase [Thiomicrorhabdus xiamenensis]QKI89442.1 N-acetylmuramoyl-L-alanine amidase [Thiomicrorhabdus xiamenensis]
MLLRSIKQVKRQAELLTSAVLLCALLGSSSVWAKGAIDKIRVGQDSQKTRVVFDLKDRVNYKVMRLSNPSRVEVVFKQAESRISFKNKTLNDPRLYKLDVDSNPQVTKVTLKLHRTLDVSSFHLAKNAQGFERLVVDLRELNANKKSSLDVAEKKIVKKTTTVAKPVSTHNEHHGKTSELAHQSAKPSPNIKSSEAKQKTASVVEHKVSDTVAEKTLQQLARELSDQLKNPLHLPEKGVKEVVIALDAGHGGKDSGAINRQKKIMEKDVTLQLAKQLKKKIDAEPHMRAVLTRDRDVFIPLHERVKIAKEQGADIFISIHADAFSDHRVRGGSVYVLSRRGASSTMARLLAKRENAYLQDVSLSGFDNDVAYALSDLSRQANVEHSRKLANSVLAEMKGRVSLHKEHVQSAGFAVLKSIDIPSMLIETAFISNPHEARNLVNPKFQRKMASAIVKGLNRYVVDNINNSPDTMPDTLFVRYKVQSGDTLSGIARRFNAEVSRIKQVNRIKNADHIYRGKVLRIPVTEQLLARLDNMT